MKARMTSRATPATPPTTPPAITPPEGVLLESLLLVPAAPDPAAFVAVLAGVVPTIPPLPPAVVELTKEDDDVEYEEDVVLRRDVEEEYPDVEEEEEKDDKEYEELVEEFDDVEDVVELLKSKEVV